jgi:hypothetical protein
MPNGIQDAINSRSQAGAGDECQTGAGDECSKDRKSNVLSGDMLTRGEGVNGRFLVGMRYDLQKGRAHRTASTASPHSYQAIL